MAKIPEQVKNVRVIPSLKNFLWHQGKVRDTYKMPIKGKAFNSVLLPVATDRISIFDFVLNALISRKGEVLTALTHFWLAQMFRDFPNHLIPTEIYGSPRNFAADMKIDFKDMPLERCLAVREVGIPPYEIILRHHIGGSVFKKYQETGMAGGQELPPNLPKWSALDKPIFTPSTKADEGHDINIDADAYFEAMGDLGSQSVEMFMKMYMEAYAYAKKRGILILDTKFEGLDIVADEVLTPDSSRFTTIDDWKIAIKKGRDPIFYDKELVRQWGKTVETPFGVTGIHKLDPENDEHVAFVHSLKLPEEIVEETTRRYLDIFERLTEMSLDDYQKENLLVD